MSRIQGHDTGPELVVRRRLHAMGYRYRLHSRDLPGKPDLVFPSRRAVVFVHGCFWHRHSDPACRLARLPKSRLDFWVPKLERNVQRDARNIVALEGMGWRAFTAWECEVSKIDILMPRLTFFLAG